MIKKIKTKFCNNYKIYFKTRLGTPNRRPKLCSNELEKRFGKVEDLIKINNLIDSIECPECQLRLPLDESKIKNHFEGHLLNDIEIDGKFKCTKCSKLFNERKHCREHIRLVHSENSVKCEKCNKELNHNKLLTEIFTKNLSFIYFLIVLCIFVRIVINFHVLCIKSEQILFAILRMFLVNFKGVP